MRIAHKLISVLVLIALSLATQGASAHAQPTPQAGSTGAFTLTDCKLDTGVGTPKRPIDARCGTFQVPEDRATPGGRKLDLAVVVLPARDPAAKGLPIFHLEGGPGGSAISNFGQAWFVAYEQFRQTHPVVLIDQRGVGKSTSLQCTEATDNALSDLSEALKPDAERARSVERSKACLTRLSASTDPKFYTSSAAADDLDEVRSALGYDKILVFGNSYGTWLGQYYLKLHGDRVAGMILDSVVGPWNTPNLDYANSGDASLNKVIALCAADSACNKAFPDLPGKLREAFARLDKATSRTNGTSGITTKPYSVVMTRERLQTALFELLYNSANISLIPQSISDAARGVYTFPATVLVTGAETAADAISIGLNQSVYCSESVNFTTDETIARFANDTLLFGSKDEFAQTAKAALENCKAWRTLQLPAADVAPITSDVPVLILSGDLDPITPIRYGEETRARLKKGQLVTFPYQGHGVIINSKCAQVIMGAFLENPTTKLDTACTGADLKPIFAGAFAGELVPFNDPAASFIGQIPKGWKTETGAELTFATSPDGLQFVAAGAYKNTDLKTAREKAIKAVTDKYGAVAIQQELTQSLIIISITAIAHGLDRPDQASTGVFYLRPDGKNVLVVWQAAPNNWFQAASLVYGAQMLGTIRAR